MRQQPEFRTSITMHGDQPTLVGGEGREVGREVGREEISWKEAMEVGQRREEEQYRGEVKFHRPSGHVSTRATNHRRTEEKLLLAKRRVVLLHQYFLPVFLFFTIFFHSIQIFF